MIDITGSLTEAIATGQNGLNHVKAALENGELAAPIDAALTQILDMKGRLIVVGMGKSGHIARKLAATFASTGTPALFVHPAEASHGDLGMITQQDVILMLSWSGETRELSDILTYAARFGVPTIALTGSASGTLAKRCDIAIVAPKVEEACPHNLAPTTSTLIQLAIGDAMAVTLLKMKGFTEASFRDFHPGGKLGASLLPISEIMHTGDALPLLPQTASIISVIGEISQKSVGLVGLTDSQGNLAGVITDGDIRRYLEAKSDSSMREAIWDTSAEALMTKGSVTLEPERLCARAIQILQKNKISAAFVLDGSKPVGLVTMLQLLQAGVV